MDAVTIPSHELALYIVLPIVSSVVVCCCICYCYQNRKLCFMKDHEDTLLITTNKKRFTIDLSQKKRRASNQSSDNETSSPTSPTQEMQLEPEIFVENHIIQPSMAHYAPIGQSLNIGNSHNKRKLQRNSTEGKYDRRSSTAVNGIMTTENNLTLNLKPHGQDMAFQNNTSSERLTPSGLSMAGKLPPIEERPGSSSGYSAVHRSSADSNMSDSLMVNPPLPGRRRSSMQSPIILNDINPRLYKLYASKMSSIGSDPDDDLPMLHFSLDYNTEHEVLKVKIIQARNLQNQDFSGTNDPYCTVALIPGSNPRKSRVHRKTSDPEFEEAFSFSVASDEIKNKILQVKTYDFDQFSRDECIGIMEIKLKDIDFVMTSHIDLWRHIRSLPPTKVHGNDKVVSGKYGDLMISLSYLKSAEKLTVAIQKARNLRDARMGIPDSYVKVCLYKGKQRIKKKKTSINHNESHPVFNQALIFNVPLDVIQAPDTSMVCYLVHDLKFGVNEYLGQLELGSDVNDANDRAHWNEMLSQNSSKPIARWHSLEPPQMADTLDQNDQPATKERRTSLGVIKLGKLKHLTTASSPTLRRSIT